MSALDDFVQTADWKKEKHVPVIDVAGTVGGETPLTVSVSVGKEIPHPNTTEHHIAWIKLFFKPAGGKFAYHVGSYEFAAHGATTDGANTGPVYAGPALSASVAVTEPGTFLALSYCNIHGLWQGSAEVGA
jgi:superoxide reductase